MTVFQIDVDKVRQRADFFLVEANQMCSEPRFAEYGFELTEENALYLAEAYFLVNDAYKELRQNEGHRTQPPKIAAITSTVVATLNPLRPTKPPSSPTKVTTYVNPLFALRLACNIVDHPFHKRPWFQKMWFCDHLRSDFLSCLEGYLEAVRNGTRQVGTEYDIALSLDELRRLEGRFGFYTVLGEMRIYQDSALKPAGQ